MEAKEVEKFYKRYESCVVGTFVPIKSVGALQSDLKKDYVITKELSILVGNLTLRCGRLLMVANTALFMTKLFYFQCLQSRDAEGYLLSRFDEVPAKQSSATAEQLASIAD